MIALAESKNLLLAEAMWTRYLPSAKIIAEVIARGDIGEIMTVSANVGDRNYTNKRSSRKLFVIPTDIITRNLERGCFSNTA